MDIILPITNPDDARRILAGRARALRLARGWSRAELADRSGVSEPTIKNFERTGQLTLKRLMLIARALDALQTFEPALQPPAARSLDEIEARATTRLRGRRRTR